MAPRKNLDIKVDIRKGLEAGKAVTGGKMCRWAMKDGDEVVVDLETLKEKKSRSKKQTHGDDEDDDNNNMVETNKSEIKSIKKFTKDSKKETTTPVKEPVVKDEEADDAYNVKDVIVKTPKVEKMSVNKSAKNQRKNLPSRQRVLW